MSTLSVGTVKATTFQTAAGVEVYTCKAWVNFNGTGTVAIRASGNVSSITDNGVGDYTVNFTTAMPDVNYSYSLAAKENTTSNSVGDFYTNAFRSAGTLAGSVRVASRTSTTAADAVEYCVAIFR